MEGPRRRLPNQPAETCPNVSVLTLDCQILTAENQLQNVAILTATPGSEDAERLAFLSVIGSQQFEDSRLPPS